MSYLLIPRIRVQNANAQPAWWMIGPPPITAYAGFSHALALALGWEKCAGFGVVHHDIQFLGEFEGEKGPFLPHQFRAASLIDKDDYSSKNQYALSSQPTARCHLIASIVIKINDDDGVDLESAFPRFMRGARLAGGAIIEYGKASLHVDMDAVIKFIKVGHVIHERQDLMVLQEGERDMLDVVLRLTDPQLRFEATNLAKSARREKPGDREEDSHSWLMPTALGYRAITEFQNRKNVRGGLPHAFAEPLVGMVQYKTLRSAGIPIWRATNPDAQTFLVSTSN